VRTFIERLPVSGAADIERRMPKSGGYDCAFSKPMSSKQLVRLEGYIEQPRLGSLLTSPLTQSPCVFHTSVVSRQMNDGVHPVPEAFACEFLNFCVTIVGAPDVQVEVRGKDVTLLDMCDGRFAVERNESTIPDHWHDFISAHRTAPHLKPDARGTTLEFKECALRVGSLVTLVGELHRDPGGTLSLRPWSGDGSGFDRTPRERWRTSWEAGDDVGSKNLTPRGESWQSDSDRETHEPRIEKVLVSDDWRLLSHGSTAAWDAHCGRNLLRDLRNLGGTGFPSFLSDPLVKQT
jgi:hypothetical protein